MNSSSAIAIHVKSCPMDMNNTLNTIAILSGNANGTSILSSATERMSAVQTGRWGSPRASEREGHAHKA